MWRQAPSAEAASGDHSITEESMRGSLTYCMHASLLACTSVEYMCMQAWEHALATFVILRRACLSSLRAQRLLLSCHTSSSIRSPTAMRDSVTHCTYLIAHSTYLIAHFQYTWEHEWRAAHMDTV